MAKTKNSRKATARGGNSKAVRIIAAVVLLVIIAALAIAFGVAYKSYNSVAETFTKFYVDVNGNRYYDGGNVQLKSHTITTFKCGYDGGKQSADKLYNVKVTSTATERTAFTYTLNGAKRMFLDGEDYTQFFDISETAADTFSVSHVKDTPATILQRRFEGKTVVAPETDPNISYFLLTVSSADNSQSVSFTLTFENIRITIDPSEGIIF
ncbi:MAG: hypothetical protein NC311_12360 [Muribaculaceae bacterium]|nr:hypothetical protein [Muribaculaceae bacterium]